MWIRSFLSARTRSNKYASSGGIAISWKSSTLPTLMATASMTKQRPRKKSFFFLIFLGALLCSLGIHLVLLKKVSSWPTPGFSAASYDIIVPRTFRMKRVEIDPKTLEETKELKTDAPAERPVTLEKEIPSPEQAEPEKKVAALIPQPTNLLPSKAEETPTGDQKEKAILPEAKSLFDKETHWDMPDNGKPLKIPELNQQENGKEGTSKFISVDDLLAGEPVKGEVLPILMPTDLLFEYDSDVLKPEAAATLGKLGSLIQKNGSYSFRIEGHTDSFGSELYNEGLSLRRAEAVKSWLKSTMGLPGDRITTVGLGKNRLLVPATVSVEGQQLNRRVEIIMKLPETPVNAR